jgi:tetratricopeptide (TPR) repeat protein
VPIDREAALKRAEKLLRQGKLAGAIEEYVRLIEDQPRDWNAINALGDLYVRAGDTDRAVAQFTRVADHLFGEGFLQRAAALYKKALKVQSQHEHTLSQLAEIAARQGVLVDAKTYLRQLEEVRRGRGDQNGVAECRARLGALENGTEVKTPAPAAAPPPPPVEDEETALFARAQRELAGGSDLQAQAILTRLLTLDPGRHAEVLGLALDLARGGRIDSAYGCVDVVADAALLAGDLNRAIEALQAFAAALPHVPALVKLVEVCVDAGRDAPMRAAQAQLADAYLDAGSGAEARVIAEDLLEFEPGNPAHAERLSRAFTLLGLPPPEPMARETDASEPVDMPPPADTPRESVEVDLTEALSGVSPAPPAPVVDDSATTFVRGMQHLQAGRVVEGAEALEAAARNPRTRSKAAAELGRLHIRRGDLPRGIEWLQQAADGPAATPDDGFGVLYDLADALERAGEPARALAIFIDLDADAGGYRDVRARIESLARAQAVAPAAQTGRGEPGSPIR